MKCSFNFELCHTMEILDDKDRKIIELLLQDSSKSVKTISDEIEANYKELEGKISPTTVHNRIKKLKDKGIIKKYTLEVDRSKLYGDILAFILMSVSGKEIPQREIVEQLMVFEEVEEVAIVTGEVDLLLRIRVESIDELNKFILDKLRNIEGIATSSTMISLEYRNKREES